MTVAQSLAWGSGDQWPQQFTTLNDGALVLERTGSRPRLPASMPARMSVR